MKMNLDVRNRKLDKELRRWKLDTPNSKFQHLMSRNLRGQTLVEILVSLSIIAVIIGAIGTALISSLDNAQYTKNQAVATDYAQEGIEVLRSIRNTGYTQFKNYSGRYCLGKNQTTLGPSQASCSTPNVDNFIRSVRIEQSPGCGVNVARITVTVAWRDGKCSTTSYCHKAEHVSCLSTVNPIPAP